MVVGTGSAVVGGGCSVVSVGVSVCASRWCKDSTLCISRQQVGGVGGEGGCQQRGVLQGGGWYGGVGRGGGM